MLCYKLYFSEPEMLSPNEDSAVSNGVSSVTLPECGNGWETSSTCTTEESSGQSSRRSTMDELIGSPGLSPISPDADMQSDNSRVDQDTIISLNEVNTLVRDNLPVPRVSPIAYLSPC